MYNRINSRIVPLAIIAISVFSLLLVSFKVISYGYMPSDDAMRHVAKAISGKSWDEVLVIRPGIMMYSHSGWHAILIALHKLAGFCADDLIVFSIVSLSLLFFIIPLFFLKMQESWLAALSVISIISPILIMRLFVGRPFIFTMSTILVLGFLWPRFRKKNMDWAAAVSVALLTAISTWVHGLWYLFALPLACFLFAREWRAFLILSICVITGIMAAAVLTGHPLLFLYQTLSQATGTFFTNPALSRVLVVELRPTPFDIFIPMTVMAMIIWRVLRKRWDIKVIDNPIFYLAVLGWAMGFTAWRFWLDWGMPALCVWMALEFDDFFGGAVGLLSFRRIAVAIIAAFTLFISTTADYDRRWTKNLDIEYLSQEDPALAGWLPEGGGVVYSNSMEIFYQTFYKNPKANWRYIVGFEPTWMPPEDLAIYRDIKRNFGTYKPFEPWVKKMRGQDRLIIKGRPEVKPDIPELEWKYAAKDIWIGRRNKI